MNRQDASVWVLTAGEYEDERIIGIYWDYVDADRAKLNLKDHPDPGEPHLWRSAEVTRWAVQS